MFGNKKGVKVEKVIKLPPQEASFCGTDTRTETVFHEGCYMRMSTNGVLCIFKRENVVAAYPEGTWSFAEQC